MKRLLLLSLALGCLSAAVAQPLTKQRDEATGKVGYTAKGGHVWIIQPQFDAGDDFSEGVARVKVGEAFGYIDARGEWVLEPRELYATYGSFKNGVAADIEYNHYIDHTFYRNIIDLRGESVGKEDMKAALHKMKKKAGKGAYTEVLGRIEAARHTVDSIVNDPYVRALSPLVRGFARINYNGKWGYVDRFFNFITKPQYNEALDFSEGKYAAVRDEDNHWAFLNRSGARVVDLSGFTWGAKHESLQSIKLMDGIYIGSTRTYGNCMFDAYVAETSGIYDIDAAIFVKNYVNLNFNRWMEKNEFETVDQWTARTAKEQQQAMLALYASQALQTYSEWLIDGGDMFALGEYDAQNHTYLLKSEMGDIPILVPQEVARRFRTEWDGGLVTLQSARFKIDEDNIQLRHVAFSMDDRLYRGDLEMPYTAADVADANKSFSLQIEGYHEEIVSDVDENIPQTNRCNDRTFAVIIANERYEYVDPVEFAEHDGSVFRDYCIHTLGIPEENIQYRANATLNNIRQQLDWLEQVSTAYEGDIDVIFYYAGHGIPDESSRTAYLLPVDGYGYNVTTGYRISDLYAELSAMQTRGVTCFFDACFSGARRDGSMLVSARGVAIKVREAMPEGPMVAFSAAQSDETAFPYREKGHGLFSYYLLKKLQETKGDISLGELGDYITDQVRKQSLLVNRKSQTPSVISAAEISDTWRGRQLVAR